MDRPSDVGNSGQIRCISPMSSPDAANNSQNITLTRGLRDRPAQAIPTTQLSERSVVKAKPTSYLSWLTNPVKQIARATALFSYDLAQTTYQTLTEGWSSIGQGVSEASKSGIGTLGFAASLAQAGVAAAGEFAETKGITLPDRKVDMVGWALAKVGIKTLGVPKSELRQLGMSLAKLHMGKKQDINITQGRLQLTSNSDHSAGLKWARSYRPENSQTSSSHAQGVPASSNNSADSNDPVIRVGNIHLEGVQPGTVKPGKADSKGNARENLTIKADRLAFEVEYESSGLTVQSQEQPITLSVEINEPELIGESNLLSLVATAINRYCSQLKHHLPGAIFPGRDDIPTEPPLWNQEETGCQLKSQSAFIEVRNIKSLAPDMSDYIPDVTRLSLIDLNAGLHQSLTGDQASKPNVFFDSLEFSDNQAGPFHIRTGQMKLDEDMNGSLDIMVQTPFSKLEEFMKPLPSTAKALAKKKITGIESGHNRLGIMIHVDIARGDIDVNTLTALGVSEKKLPLFQKQIEKAALRALKSKHTRFRDLPSGSKEFKLDSIAISGKVPALLKKKLHSMTTKKTSSYYDLGDKPYIKTGAKSRGKISLIELLQLEIKPGSNPSQPS